MYTVDIFHFATRIFILTRIFSFCDKDIYIDKSSQMKNLFIRMEVYFMLLLFLCCTNCGQEVFLS